MFRLFKNPVFSQTDKLMAATKFSDYVCEKRGLYFLKNCQLLAFSLTMLIIHHHEKIS